ncbi:unnamed protein product [Symbiodinium sp. CCMP2456]|nr:unnamed protein product [Symbiodinium sp. CCMP2456]
MSDCRSKGLHYTVKYIRDKRASGVECLLCGLIGTLDTVKKVPCLPSSPGSADKGPETVAAPTHAEQACQDADALASAELQFREWQEIEDRKCAEELAELQRQEAELEQMVLLQKLQAEEAELEALLLEQRALALAERTVAKKLFDDTTPEPSDCPRRAQARSQLESEAPQAESDGAHPPLVSVAPPQMDLPYGTDDMDTCPMMLGYGEEMMSVKVPTDLKPEVRDEQPAASVEPHVQVTIHMGDQNIETSKTDQGVGDSDKIDGVSIKTDRVAGDSDKIHGVSIQTEEGAGDSNKIRGVSIQTDKGAVVSDKIGMSIEIEPKPLDSDGAGGDMSKPVSWHKVSEIPNASDKEDRPHAEVGEKPADVSSTKVCRFGNTQLGAASLSCKRTVPEEEAKTDEEDDTKDDDADSSGGTKTRAAQGRGHKPPQRISQARQEEQESCNGKGKKNKAAATTEDEEKPDAKASDRTDEEQARRQKLSRKSVAYHKAKTEAKRAGISADRVIRMVREHVRDGVVIDGEQPAAAVFTGGWTSNMGVVDLVQHYAKA